MLQKLGLVIILVGILLAALHFLLGKYRIVWLGKALGFGVGYAIAEAPGAMIGTLFGHIFDMLVQPKQRVNLGTVNQGVYTPAASPAQFVTLSSNIYFDTLFSALGNFAQASGKISTNYINFMHSLMQKMGLDENKKNEAWELFQLGQQANFNLTQALFNFSRYCGSESKMASHLMHALIDIANVELPLNMQQYTILTSVAYSLNFSTNVFAHLAPKNQGQEKFTDTTAATPLKQAYKILEVSPSATVEEIKWAYRKLMGRYHPDRIISKDLPEDLVEFATRRTQEIKSAYEKISVERNIK